MDHERMTQSYILSGEPAQLPVADVIELLTSQDAAGDADDFDEPPVFQHGAGGHDMDEGWHGRHSFDVRILTTERRVVQPHRLGGDAQEARHLQSLRSVGVFLRPRARLLEHGRRSAMNGQLRCQCRTEWRPRDED
jgi:hypothetical protein